MHFKWIFLISSCLILSASSARRGGGGYRSSGAVSRGATTFNRPSTSSVLASSPRFSSSPSFSGRGPRTNTYHTPRAASAPPLSSLPHSPVPNSIHVPRPASAPPLSSLPGPPPRRPISNSPTTGSSIPKPPPLPPKSYKPAPPKSGSGIPPPPPAPPKSNLPQNVPQGGSGKPSPSTPAVITPVVVSSIMRISPKRNSTTNGNSPTTQNHNTSLAKTTNNPGGNITVQANLSKLPPLNPMQASKNSTGGGFKNGINMAKGNAFNNTIRGSPRNATQSWGVIGNASGRNATDNAKFNGTVNAFPQVFPGKQNNTRNATGIGFQPGVGRVSQTQPSPIGKFPWEGVKSGNPQQTHWDNSVQNYDVNNGDGPRKPRSDMAVDLAKKIIKSVAAKQNNGAQSASYGLNSGLNGQSWDANRNEYVWKSSVNTKPPSPPSKMMRNQIIIITILISVVLIAAGVIVYFCNRK